MSEAIALQWSAVDFERAELHVARLKGSSDGTHPILGDELRALRRLQREQSPASPFVFVSEQGGPLTRSAVHYPFRTIGAAAGIEACHPHQARHSAGYQLAARGTDSRTLQAFLGHKYIRHTVRYSALSPAPFRNLWR